MRRKYVVIGFVVLLIIICVMFQASAATSTRVYADCSGLQDQPDGTVTQTCSLMVEVTGGSITYNDFLYTVTLNNLILKSVTPSEHWYVESLTDDQFDLQTSLTSLTGVNEIAVVVLEKIDSAAECNASFRFEYNRINRTCSVFHDNYYDSRGQLTDELTYTKEWYGYERGTTVYTGRPTEWTGQIGLMYPSDYGYATSGESSVNRASCLATALYNWNSSSYSDCKNNDWLYDSSNYQWTLTPHPAYSNNVFDVSSYVNLSIAHITGTAVSPALYLSSNVKISGGTGSSSDPYQLSL